MIGFSIMGLFFGLMAFFLSLKLSNRVADLERKYELLIKQKSNDGHDGIGARMHRG